MDSLNQNRTKRQIQYRRATSCRQLFYTDLCTTQTPPGFRSAISANIFFSHASNSGSTNPIRI